MQNDHIIQSIKEYYNLDSNLETIKKKSDTLKNLKLLQAFMREQNGSSTNDYLT